jgi:DNA-nicking Smr family endonuclease
VKLPPRHHAAGRPLRPNASADADDARLFREAVKDATPIAPDARVTASRAEARPVAVQSLLDEYDALAEVRRAWVTADDALDTGDEPSYVRDGLSSMVLRKLRRGQWVVEGELDLHGATRVEAREQVGLFLKACTRRLLRCVRIIHGKGLGSKNREPVLKHKVRAWLMQRDEVLAFCQAPATMGGSGALLVLLKA